MTIDLSRIKERAAEKAALIHSLQDNKSSSREKSDELWKLAREKKNGAQSALQDRALLDSGIPDYFPTPPILARHMITDCLRAPTGAMFLEPSAGRGSIARAGLDAGLIPYCIEVNYSLCMQLSKNGFSSFRGDFLNDFEVFPLPTFAYICMNPPFENRADIRHVMRAWSLLQPEGRLVTIMSAGTLYRSDKETQAFRAWLDNQDYEQEDLSAGTFALSGTNISSVLFTINKGK